MLIKIIKSKTEAFLKIVLIDQCKHDYYNANIN